MAINKKKTVFSEINITPLTDIFLVLLIIMMVIAPSFQNQDTAIDMPKIENGTAVDEDKATISVTSDGQYYLNDVAVDADMLYDKLEELKPKLDKPLVVVKADKNTQSAKIIEIMRAAKDAGYEKLTVAGEPLSKNEQKQLKEKSKKQITNSNVLPDKPDNNKIEPRNDVNWED